jgi:tyrosyl-tRNA synthetase
VSDASSSVVARTRLDGPGVDLAEALLATGLVKSKSDSRRTISQGGVYVNNVRRRDPATAITHEDLLQGKYVLLRKGKQDYHVLCFE